MRRTLVIALLGAACLTACGQKQPEVIIDPAPPSNAGADAGGGDFRGGAGTQTAQAGNATAGAAATPAVPPTEAEVKAAAADPNKPHRKAGLWQLTASNGEANATSTLCVTDASEVRVNAFETRRLLPFGGRPGGGGGGGGGRPGGGEGGGQRAGGGGAPGGGGGGGGFAGPGGGGGGRPGGGGGSPCPPLKISKAGAGWKGSSVCKREFGEGASMTITQSDSLIGDLQSKYTLKATRTISGAPREEMNRATTTTVNATYKGACPSGQKGGDLTINGETSNLMAGRGQGGG
jgi:hypothetical protein